MVEGVKDTRELGWWLSIPYPKRGKPLKDVITYWLETDPFPSWRRLITSLDGLKEKIVADRIRHYAEPLTGIVNVLCTTCRESTSMYSIGCLVPALLLCCDMVSQQ